MTQTRYRNDGARRPDSQAGPLRRTNRSGWWRRAGDLLSPSTLLSVLGLVIAAAALYQTQDLWEKDGAKFELAGVAGSYSVSYTTSAGGAGRVALAAYALTNTGREEADVVGVRILKPTDVAGPGCFGSTLPITLQPGRSKVFIATIPSDTTTPGSAALVLLATGQVVTIPETMSTRDEEDRDAVTFGTYMRDQALSATTACESERRLTPAGVVDTPAA